MTGIERLERYVNAVIQNPDQYPIAVGQACQRFAGDMAQADIYFDVSAAEKTIEYVELLSLTHGKWQNNPTILEHF